MSHLRALCLPPAIFIRVKSAHSNNYLLFLLYSKDVFATRLYFLSQFFTVVEDTPYKLPIYVMLQPSFTSFSISHLSGRLELSERYFLEHLSLQNNCFPCLGTKFLWQYLHSTTLSLRLFNF